MITPGTASMSPLLRTHIYEIDVPSGSDGELAAIEAVNTNFATIAWQGSRIDSLSNIDAQSDALLLQFFGGSAISAASNLSAAYDRTAVAAVHLWNPAYVVRVIHSTVTIPAGSTTDVSSAFTAITIANSILMYRGSSIDTSTADWFDFAATIEIDSTTQVRATRGGTTGDVIIYFDIVEFISGVLTNRQQYEVDITSGNTSGSTGSLTSLTAFRQFNFWNGFRVNSSTTDPRCKLNVQYAGGTTASAARGSGLALTSTAACTAVEFAEEFVFGLATGGAISNGGGGTTDVSIGHTVNPNKTLANYMGESNAETFTGASGSNVSLIILNSTQLRSQRPATGLNCAVAYHVNSFI